MSLFIVLNRGGFELARKSTLKEAIDHAMQWSHASCVTSDKQVVWSKPQSSKKVGKR